MPSSRLKVLLTTSTFPAREGDGVPRFVYDLARALSGHVDVTVLAPDAPGAARRERLGGVEVRRFAYAAPRSTQRLALGSGIPDNLRNSLGAWLQIPGYFLAQWWAMRHLLREQHFDVVNAHWIVPQALIATWVLPSRGGPALVAHGHGGDVYELRRLPMGRRIAERVLRRSHAVVLSGSGLRAVLEGVVGRRVDVTLQPMGVDLSLFSPDAAHDRASAVDPVLRREFPEGFVLFVGRLIEIKGVRYLLRAMPGIRNRHPRIGLVVIGDGPERDSLEREAHQLGLKDAVRFLGHLSHTTVADYLRECRVLVVPSIADHTGREEGMPTVLAEAMAAGARVVASASGGIPDVIRDGETGWLVRERDAEHLAARILTAIGEPEAHQVAAAGRAFSDSLSWSRTAASYVECMRNALRERRP